MTLNKNITLDEWTNVVALLEKSFKRKDDKASNKEQDQNVILIGLSVHRTVYNGVL